MVEEKQPQPLENIQSNSIDPNNSSPASINTHKPKWIAIIVCILVLGSFYSFFFSHPQIDQKKDIVKISQKPSTPTPTPTIAMRIIPTDSLPDSTTISGWKTYTDKKGGYSLDFPSDMRVKIYLDRPKALSSVQILTQYQQDSGEYIPNINDNYGKVFSLFIDVTNNTDKKTNDSIFSELKRDNIATTSSPIEQRSVDEKITNSLKPYKNNNIDGIYYFSGFDYDYDNIEMATPKYLYEFMYTGDQGGKVSKEQEALITKILSTFKIIQ